MGSEGISEGVFDENRPVVATTWVERVEEQYKRVKLHAETYPYVWGSYILVYGGLGLWLTYRWRRLRQTEARVRVLQQRLREIVEPEQQQSATSVTQKTVTPSTNKLPPLTDDKTVE